MGLVPPSEPSTKKLVLIFGIIAIGAFIILSIFVFPIKNLIRDEITAEVKIVSKNDGICVVDMADHPRGINECPYKAGDTVLVKYKEGTSDIIGHELKP
ncbi:hypothetical protein [Candidatus Nitrosocosmicus sp. T]